VTTPARSVPAGSLNPSARSDEIDAKHEKYLWPSVTNYFAQPLVADRGEVVSSEMAWLWPIAAIGK
jgi:hypothetical protein